MGTRSWRTVASVGAGTLVGLGLGAALAAPLAGLAFGLLLGAVIAARPRRCTVAVAGAGGDGGSVARPLLWLLAGFAVLGLAMLAITPELLGAAPGTLARAAVIAVAAGIPGLVVLGVLATRRRDDDPEA